MFRRIAPTAALLCSVAAAPATRPATDDLVSLGNDVVRFHAPPAPHWAVVAGKDTTADKVMFGTDDHTAAFQVEIATFQVTPATAGQIGAALAKSLHDKRQQAGTVVLLQPVLEHDRRFDIVIHERYMAGQTTVDQLHLIKTVGPKTVMVAASGWSSDPAVVTADLDAAKASLASAKFNRRPAAHKAS